MEAYTNMSLHQLRTQIQVLINNIAELRLEINGVKQIMKQGTPMTDGQLEVYDRKVVKLSKLQEKLAVMVTERDRRLPLSSSSSI
ncbi:hypothetical protein I4U23_013048 [Adineta vaga]|nr:hypothetical protein I4U23_013048 [Adineta vaga]